MFNYKYRFIKNFEKLSGVNLKENYFFESKSKITKISFYDMDETLINSPKPETSKEIYKQKTGKDWPYNGWWGKIESLDFNIFDIKPKYKIIDRLNKDNNNSNTKTVLLTARISKFNEIIEKLFNHLNIKIDDLTFKKGNKKKDERIINYIKDYPDINEIDVYDDNDNNITLINNMKEFLKEKNIKLTVYKINDNDIIKL